MAVYAAVLLPISQCWDLRRNGRAIGHLNLNATAEEAAEIARHLTQWSEDPGSPREAS